MLKWPKKWNKWQSNNRVTWALNRPEKALALAFLIRKTWKVLKLEKNTAHLLAQKLGKNKWYRSYKIRISKVEKDYEFHNPENS